jgi:hypothetical protein
MTTSRTTGTPWSLGVRCDRMGCPVRFEGDFLVAEDALLGERLKVALDHVRDKEGWQVIWPAGAGADKAETYCPAHKSEPAA